MNDILKEPPQKGISRRTASIMLITCAVLWSTSGLFLKILPWHPLVNSSLRSLIALITIYAILRPKKIEITKGSIIGGMFLCIEITLFVCANKITTSANAIVLQYTAPIFTALYSIIFMKYKMRSKDIITFLLAFIGICFVFFGKLDSGKLLGNILAILSGLTMSAYTVYCGTAKQDTTSSLITGQFMTFLIGVPFIFFIAPPVLSAPNVGVIIYLGVLQLGIPFILFARALRYATPLDGSLLTMIEPVLNPVWVFLVLKEAPSANELIGGILVITAVVFFCIASNKKSGNDAALEKPVSANE